MATYSSTSGWDVKAFQYPLLFAAGLSIGWCLAWAVAWQIHLLDAQYLQPSSDVTVFVDRTRDIRNLWIAIAASLSFVGIGIFFLVLGNLFRSHSTAWRRAWLLIGSGFVLAGVGIPILFPSAKSIAVDGAAGTVAVQTRWLYATASDQIAFDEIARINLRSHRVWIAGTCQQGVGLSIIRVDGTWLDIPFEQEAVAGLVAQLAEKALGDQGVSNC